LPGSARPVYDNVHVGVQRKHDVVSLVRGDAAAARWDLDVALVADKRGGLDFRGPWVQGKLGDRFIYLSWGECDALGHFLSFRRAKLMLAAIDEEVVQAAFSTGQPVEGRLPLTDAQGGPLCAAVRPPTIRWALAPE
jgi:hypothetical protein